MSCRGGDEVGAADNFSVKTGMIMVSTSSDCCEGSRKYRKCQNSSWPRVNSQSVGAAGVASRLVSLVSLAPWAPRCNGHRRIRQRIDLGGMFRSGVREPSQLLDWNFFFLNRGLPENCPLFILPSQTASFQRSTFPMSK